MDIKTIIKEKGYTQEEVASAMQVTRMALVKTLAGNPTIKTLQRIADIIGCSVGDFFRDERQPAQPTILCPHCGKVIRLTIKPEEDYDNM